MAHLLDALLALAGHQPVRARICLVLLQVRGLEALAAAVATGHLAQLALLLLVVHAVAVSHLLGAAPPPAVHPPELARLRFVEAQVFHAHTRAALLRAVNEAQDAHVRHVDVDISGGHRLAALAGAGHCAVHAVILQVLLQLANGEPGAKSIDT